MRLFCPYAKRISHKCCSRIPSNFVDTVHRDQGGMGPHIGGAFASRQNSSAPIRSVSRFGHAYCYNHTPNMGPSIAATSQCCHDPFAAKNWFNTPIVSAYARRSTCCRGWSNGWASFGPSIHASTASSVAGTSLIGVRSASDAGKRKRPTSASSVLPAKSFESYES